MKVVLDFFKNIGLIIVVLLLTLLALLPSIIAVTTIILIIIFVRVGELGISGAILPVLLMLGILVWDIYDNVKLFKEISNILKEAKNGGMKEDHI